MYYIFFAIVFVCFGFHTTIHLLEHFRRLAEHKSLHTAIGITMLLGWFSYFYLLGDRTSIPEGQRSLWARSNGSSVRISAGGPAAQSLPASMIATRSDSSQTSAIS